MSMLMSMSKMLTMRRRVMMMLRKAELTMVLAAGSNVRVIRTEDGGRFTSTRALPYIAHTYMHLHCIVHTCIYTDICSGVSYIHKYTQKRVHIFLYISMYFHVFPYLSIFFHIFPRNSIYFPLYVPIFP